MYISIKMNKYEKFNKNTKLCEIICKMRNSM